MWENQIAPHRYDCQRLQQEQAPEQWGAGWEEGSKEGDEGEDGVGG